MMELKDCVRIVKKRLWLIVLCVVVSTLTTALFSHYNSRPIYQASTKLIVNKTIEQGQLGKEQMDFGAISTSISLIDTYKEIIKTPAIMDKVIQRYPDLRLTEDQLIKSINVSALNGTQVMTLMAIDLSYERAVKIVNAVSEVFKSEIPKIMKVDNVTILNVAKMNDNPQPLNLKTNQNIIISFAVSLLFGVGIAFLLEFLDDTLKTKEDVEAALGLPTFSVIPVTKVKALKLQRSKRASRRQVGEAPYATTRN
ncbi:YveK family protein [Paenibacillus piri]|uniref:Lipopolysaccharide biosynthesis protein n=1 Tax=Paenibacillus piri TaxID=2547395 RepID=A0A4R5KYZ6_9BACL|nr:Wzz/FepE/Etk N-terminal domain-containing protein [Paenibacillus piri]TDG00301.1 lipopolysaccharide biosynthesis protein [Paenibacillus piri]